MKLVFETRKPSTEFHRTIFESSVPASRTYGTPSASDLPHRARHILLEYDVSVKNTGTHACLYFTHQTLPSPSEHNEPVHPSVQPLQNPQALPGRRNKPRMHPDALKPRSKGGQASSTRTRITTPPDRLCRNDVRHRGTGPGYRIPAISLETAGVRPRERRLILRQVVRSECRDGNIPGWGVRACRCFCCAWTSRFLSRYTYLESSVCSDAREVGLVLSSLSFQFGSAHIEFGLSHTGLDPDMLDPRHTHIISGL